MIFLVCVISALCIQNLVSAQDNVFNDEGSTGDCTTDTCVGNRECVNNVCQCLTGYEGTDCTVVSCGDPITLENGSHQGTDYTYLQRVVFSCNTGYSLRNDERAECTATKAWEFQPTGTAPVCVLNAVAGCASDPCQNGGVCTDTNTNTGTFTCDCTTSYTGDLCETSTANTQALQYNVGVRSIAAWEAAMADPNTVVAQTTCQEFIEKFGPQLQAQFPGLYQQLEQCALSEGSVIANFVMKLDPSANLAQSDVLNKVKTAITQVQTQNNGSSDLFVFDETYTSVDVLVPYGTPISGVSTGALAAYISVGVFVLIILVLVVLIAVQRYRNKKKRKRRSRSSYSDEDFEMDSLSHPQLYPFHGHHMWRPQPRDIAYYPAPQAELAALPTYSYSPRHSRISNRENVYNWAEVGGTGINIFGGNGFGKRQEYF